MNLTDKQSAAISKVYKDAGQIARTESLESKKSKGYLDFSTDSKEFKEGYKEAAEVAAQNARSKIILAAETRIKVYALLNKDQKLKFLELNSKSMKRTMRPKPGDRKK